MLTPFKILIVLGLIYLLFRQAIHKRWPNFGRKVRLVLVTSLIVVTIYRLVIELTHME